MSNQSLNQLVSAYRDLTKRVRSIEMQLGKARSTEIAASYYHNDFIVLSRGVEKIIDYNHEIYDTDSAVTTGLAWNFEVPENGDGLYLVIACLCSTPTSDPGANDDRLEVRTYINGSLESRTPEEAQYHRTGAPYYFLHALSRDIFDLQEGNTIQIKGYYEGPIGTTITLNADSNLNFVSIGRIRY